MPYYIVLDIFVSIWNNYKNYLNEHCRDKPIVYEMAYGVLLIKVNHT